MSPAATLKISGNCMQLVGELNFVSVVPLQSQGDSWLLEGAPAACRLDMSGVSRSNSAGTALLVAWLRTAAAAGKSLRVEGLPEDLRALLQLAGLDRVLRDVAPAATPDVPPQAPGPLPVA